MVFEFSEESLYDVMIARKKTMTTGIPTNKRSAGFFTEHEAWTILTQIIQGLTHLADFQLFFGDVQPNNIMVFDKSNLRIKLFDPKYCLGERTAYRRKLHDYDNQTPLCPYGMQELKNKVLNPRMAPDKSEIFALGITMVSMLLCEDFVNYYDFRSFTIDFEQIGSKLGKLHSAGYSNELLSIIEAALTDEEFKRPNIQRMAQMVLTSPKNTYITQGPISTTSTTAGDYSRQSANSYVDISNEVQSKQSEWLCPTFWRLLNIQTTLWRLWRCVRRLRRSLSAFSLQPEQPKANATAFRAFTAVR